jgi:hypothetical protein
LGLRLEAEEEAEEEEEEEGNKLDQEEAGEEGGEEAEAEGRRRRGGIAPFAPCTLLVRSQPNSCPNIRYLSGWGRPTKLA